MTNATPNLDPANDESLTGLMRTVAKKEKQETDGMLPVTVIAFDRSTNRVQVQPSIRLVGTNGQQIPRAQISSIPVVQIGGGGFGIFFNIKSGDKGWIIAADRDISVFLQSYKESPPQTFRMKNFADSIFIPDVMTDFTIIEEDAESLVIQKSDGTVRISLSQDSIKLTAPNTKITSNLKIEGALEITGATKITGNLSVVGNITATGSITPDVPP